MSISPSCIWPVHRRGGRVFLFLREDPDVVRLVDGEVGALGEAYSRPGNQNAAKQNAVDNINRVPPTKGGTDPTYELDPIEVQYALDWLKVKAPEEAVGFEVAVKGGRKLMSRSEAGALGGRGNKASDNVTSFDRGNRSDYILARLERDRPDILNEFHQGVLVARGGGCQEDPFCDKGVIKM
ncbi:MAG: hypothetical protein EOM37_13330 [Proteobacteria bacterium]|nr:hypothetical protein [Pseudomonadota bacterium]